MKPTAKEEATIQGIELQATTLSYLRVADHQAELTKAGTDTVKTDKDVTDIVTGSGLGAMPHVK